MKTNKILNLIIIVIVCTLSMSCKDKKIIKWDYKSKTSFTTLINKIEIYPLQTKNVSLIGANPKLIFSDSCYYVIDKFGSKTVKKFDIKGNYIRDIGEVGKNEGQYLNIKSVSINAKDIYINNGNNKITVYSKDGAFKKNIETDFPIKDFITYKNRFLINIGYNNEFCDERLLQTDRNFKLKKKFLPLKTKAININDNNNFTMYNNKIFIKEAFENTIYTLKNNKIEEHCSFCFKGFNINKKYFSDKNPVKAFKKLNNKGFALIYNYIKNKSTTVVEVKFYKHHLINRVFGIERNNKWNWINTIRQSEVSTCAGIFQQITSDNKLLGIVFPSELLELYERVPELFKQKEMIKNLKEDDNPLIIVTSLK